MEDLPSGLINIDVILSDSSSEAEAALISYARYLSGWRLSSKNVQLYLKLLSVNKPTVADNLMNKKNPVSFFSNIEMNREVIISVLMILRTYNAETLYDRVLYACLGILINTYLHGESGMKIYALSVSDIQHIGKYLASRNDELRNLIIEILNSLKILPSRYTIARFCSELVDTYFDRNKKIDSIIPGTLLG